ncbi:MAG: amidohydrolase family protein [Verrucomicrobiota bacterium]
MIQSVYDLEICDCHHHLWDLKELSYPWLMGNGFANQRVCGDYEGIRNRNFLLKDFRENRGRLKVTRLVHEEAVVDRADPVAETRWLQRIADDSDSEGMPHGIVAYADFSRDDIEAILESHCSYPNIRGIRQLVHEAYIDPEDPKLSLLEESSWRTRVGLCEKYGLSFDLQIYPQQASDAEKLVAEHPGVTFIVTHSLLPVSKDADYMEVWEKAVKRIARFDNANIKLSGFGMFDRDWNADTVSEVVLRVIDAFGARRCAFASNFPVDSLAKMTYVGLWETFFEVVREFSDGEKAALFSETAKRLYRL